eukprot:snap_masked-scaffold_41-processed-gene-2.55-mRNA-1 protein AED:0.18 eAED:0.19 QI:0/-1/0/1/-1/1/1/0/347
MYINTTVKSKYFPKFEEKLPDQHGKVTVITGTTSGTGFVAACTSLKKGAFVYALNRPSQKNDLSIKKLLELFPEASDQLKVVKCDLQDFESVKAAASEVIENSAEGIDVLCNNAGIFAFKNQATEDGYEIQMQTNFLSAALLTKLLLPLLLKRVQFYREKYKNEKTKENKKNLDAVRVVMHSSLARMFPFIKLEKKYFEKDMSVLGDDGQGVNDGRYTRYHMSKLACSIFTLALDKRFSKNKSGILSVCAHPGVAITEITKTTFEENGLNENLSNVMKDGQSPEDGTMGLLKCMFGKVSSATLYGPHWSKGKANKTIFGPTLHGKKSQKLLWEVTENIVGEFNFSVI